MKKGWSFIKNSDAFDAINDSYVSVFSASPTEEQVRSIFLKIPLDIKQTAIQWGWYDTVVSDKVYNFLKSKK